MTDQTRNRSRWVRWPQWPSVRYTTPVLVSVGCLLAAAAWSVRATPREENSPEEDPVPIRRVLLPPAQLADELGRVRRGVLLQMPQSEFDALIRRARSAVRGGQMPPALVEMLQSGALGGAALDVFADEPNVPQALLGLDNVVLSPHQGSATHKTRWAMGDLVVRNLKAHFAGEPLISPVV